MKKMITLMGTLLLGASQMFGQQDCFQLFPTTPGTLLHTNTFTPKGELMCMSFYRIQSVSQYHNGSQMEISYAVNNNAGEEIGQGQLLAKCTDNTLYLNLVNRTISPEMIHIMSSHTELISEFLDYPQLPTLSVPDGEDIFAMEGGEFVIKSKKNPELNLRVVVSNRGYLGVEKIKTPAGEFDAYKIAFDFAVHKEKKTIYYNGIEWYAEGAGIVRTETYDSKGDLINYSVLNKITE